MAATHQLPNGSKQLEQYTPPELAQLLVEDPRRQDFALIWNDETVGLVNDKVQMIRAAIDRGEDLDQTNEHGRTAVEILVDPANYIATDTKTVLALLQAGAGTCPEVMRFAVARLYSDNTREVALMFHERAQTDKPLADPSMGNYYHAMIDADPDGVVLIEPMLDMVRRHDVDREMDPAEIALFASWLMEPRAFDGNTPVMLGWDIIKDRVFENSGHAHNFQQFTLPDLWALTARYLRAGGDLQQKNHQGRSILSNILAHDPNLDCQVWTNGKIDERLAEHLRSHIGALAISSETPAAPSKAARARM